MTETVVRDSNLNAQVDTNAIGRLYDGFTTSQEEREGRDTHTSFADQARGFGALVGQGFDGDAETTGFFEQLRDSAATIPEQITGALDNVESGLRAVRDFFGGLFDDAEEFRLNLPAIDLPSDENPFPVTPEGVTPLDAVEDTSGAAERREGVVDLLLDDLEQNILFLEEVNGLEEETRQSLIRAVENDEIRFAQFDGTVITLFNDGNGGWTSEAPAQDHLTEGLRFIMDTMTIVGQAGISGGVMRLTNLGPLSLRGTVTLGRGLPIWTSEIARRADAAWYLRTLADASLGEGLFTIGSASRAQSSVLGRAWVGPNFRVSSDGTAWISADGLRQYRPPSAKPNNPRATTGIQANFESRPSNNGSWVNNGHLNIEG